LAPKQTIAAISALHANPWNPNKMTAFMYAKALESISEFGFIDPITCLPDYTIIDGEHRWKAARDLGLKEVPVVILDITPEQARKLTVVLNELHGQADPTKLSDLLSSLLTGATIEDVLHSMPFTEDILRGYLGFRDLELPTSEAAPQGSSSGTARESWVERLFKVPIDVGYLMDDAIAKAKQDEFVESGDRLKDWQALERIIAEYMAG